MLCGSYVMAFDIHFGRLEMVACKAITLMSSFLVVGSEFRTAQKVHAILICIIISPYLYFVSCWQGTQLKAHIVLFV
jgi:hypothetical protein